MAESVGCDDRNVLAKTRLLLRPLLQQTQGRHGLTLGTEIEYGNNGLREPIYLEKFLARENRQSIQGKTGDIRMIVIQQIQVMFLPLLPFVRRGPKQFMKVAKPAGILCL